MTMDQQSSSPANHPSSPDDGAPGSASKQYTTAGTLYKPNATQPLQPPTRRGRPLKWSAAGCHSELSLLPKTALAALSFGRATGSDTTTISPTGGRFAALRQLQKQLPQYTPLQQNYDRAANPSFEAEETTTLKMSLAPLMRSGNTPALILSDNKHDDQTDDSQVSDGSFEEEYDDDEDGGGHEDLATDLLLQMPVKSLHNLASYPNPSQKKAQKFLQRGKKPDLVGLGIGSTSSASSTPIRPAGNAEFRDATASATPRATTSDYVSRRDPALDGWSSSNVVRPSSKRLSRHRFTENSDATGPEQASTALSTGPGAPRPLTAGPPGQRQYRPSTFESTFKALHSKGDQKDRFNDEESESAPPGLQGTSQRGADDQTMSQGSFPVSPSAVDSTSKQQKMSQSVGTVFDEYLIPTQHSVWARSVLGPVGTAADSRIVIPGVSDSLWPEDGLNVPGQRRPGRMTDEELAARNQRINDLWYAGAGLLGKATSDHMNEARQRAKKVHKYGVIGDQRPSLDKAKIEYPHIDIKDANRMPVSEHAAPLINMMFGAILRQARIQQDNEAYAQYDDPTSELVNDSPLGQSSFYKRLLDLE